MADPKKILVIDEDANQRNYLSAFLDRMEFDTDDAASFHDAADKLLSDDDFSLALIRFIPYDSFSLGMIHSIKTFNPHLGILMLADIGNPDFAISLLEKGTIDQVASPDNLAAIFSAIKNHQNRKDLLHKNKNYARRLRRYKIEQQNHLKKTLELEDIYDATLENLMMALDLRDVETFGHSRSVAKYSLTLAQLLGIQDKSSLDNIKKGALLHDVGKIAIPDAILKKTSPLTDMEWEKIKLHPSLGYGLIKEIKLVKEIGDIILYHHERYDGSGYPKGLQGNDIPKEARIFAVADALDAITSHRPYREESDFAAAQLEITNGSGIQFDPEVVQAFCGMELDKWQKIRFETTKILPSMEEMLRIT